MHPEFEADDEEFEGFIASEEAAGSKAEKPPLKVAKVSANFMHHRLIRRLISILCKIVPRFSFTFQVLFSFFLLCSVFLFLFDIVITYSSGVRYMHL